MRSRATPLRALSLRAIWGGAALLLVVGAVTGWLLLRTLGSESPRDRARLEVIRTTISIVASTGGAAALLLAARRQRTNELTLIETKHDATERRTTELYSAAIDSSARTKQRFD